MNKELLDIMELCGHFLYHRRGGKRGQGRILRLLNARGPMTQTELLECIQIQAGSLSEIVSKLLEQNLITKERDTADRRKFTLAITEKGKEVVVTNNERNKEQEEKLFEVLSKEEQEELSHLLEKLFKDWERNFDKSLFQHRKGEVK